MAEDLEQITTVDIDISDLTPRLEHIKMPNGVTYKVGLSLEEQKSVVDALSDLDDNINAVNDDLEDLSGVTGIEKDAQTDERVFVPTINYGGDTTTIMGNMQSLDTKIKALEDEITELKSLLRRQYMAYYDVNPSEGIGENNVYVNSQQ